MCSLLGAQQQSKPILSWSPSERMLLQIKSSYLFHRVQRLKEIHEKTAEYIYTFIYLYIYI